MSVSEKIAERNLITARAKSARIYAKLQAAAAAHDRAADDYREVCREVGDAEVDYHQAREVKFG